MSTVVPIHLVVNLGMMLTSVGKGWVWKAKIGEPTEKLLVMHMVKVRVIKSQYVI